MSCWHTCRKVLATIFCCCCKKQQSKFMRGYSMSSELAEGQIQADCAKLSKLYFTKEDELLATDYEGNVTFVRILRENPHIILRNGDKYESHILELARLREDLVSMRETIEIITEKKLEQENAIKGPDEFDADDNYGKDGTTMRESMTQFIDPQLESNRFELSRKWSEKLKETQNLIRPKWPDYLPVVKFDVFKVNKIGRRLRRMLTFTQQSVLNANFDDGVLKKVYNYNEINLAGLIDENAFALYMKNGHQINFETDNAAHVVQQLMSRVKFRLRLDRISFSSTDTTTKYIINQIAYENAMGHDAYITFAEELKQSFMSSIKEKDLHENGSSKSINSAGKVGGGEDGNEVVNPIASSATESNHRSIELTSVLSLSSVSEVNGSDRIRSSSEYRVSESSEGSSEMPSRRQERRATRTNIEAKQSIHQMFKEGSKEHMTQNAVRKLLFSRQSSEGNTRLAFTTSFNAEDKHSLLNPSSIRSYNDFKLNMFEFILKKRGKQLAEMFMGHSTPVINDESDNFDVSYVRDIEEEDFCNLCLIVYNVVEASLLDSVLEQSFLKHIDEIKRDERELKLRLVVFAGRDQHASHIAKEFISPLGWKSAIFELSTLETQLTPWDMLNTLIRTSKSIYSEYKHAILSHSSDRDVKPLGADDIVPIFIYVFCQSQFSRPLVAKEIMWHLSHPSLLHGECGYYLTIYDSCVQYILNDTLNPDEAEKYKSLKEKYSKR